MKSTIKAIVFDFGGVLIDWNPRYLYKRYFPQNPEAMENFLAEINFSEWNAQQDKGRSFAEGVALLSEQFPQHAHLIQAYYDCWEDSISGPINGSVDILRKLKDNGYSLYGLSNWSAETYPRVRRKYAFFELFDEVILSGAFRLNKPDPAIFELFLSKTGYLAPECLLIDDFRSNIDAAKDLGFVTIHFTSPGRLQTELQSLGLP